MADETAIINGVKDNQTAAENFYDLENGENETKLKQKIETLEHEKVSLVNENEEVKGQITKLTAEVESLKSDDSELKLRVLELETEVEQSADGKRALESVAKRAAQLETEVARLQHDLISSMNEGDEANVQILELKRELGEKEVKIEELKREKAEIEKKVRELERKIGVLEMKEIEEKSKKVRIEEEMREKMGEKENEILVFTKRIEELKSEVEGKRALEEKLSESEETAREMEGKIVELQKEVEAAEKVIGGLKERTRQVINGIEIETREEEFKVQWPVVAIGSMGAVVAVAAMVYVSYAKRP